MCSIGWKSWLVIAGFHRKARIDWGTRSTAYIIENVGPTARIAIWEEKENHLFVVVVLIHSQNVHEIGFFVSLFDDLLFFFPFLIAIPILDGLINFWKRIILGSFLLVCMMDLHWSQGSFAYLRFSYVFPRFGISHLPHCDGMLVLQFLYFMIWKINGLRLWCWWWYFRILSEFVLAVTTLFGIQIILL